jgi:hypothetical protein
MRVRWTQVEPREGGIDTMMILVEDRGGRSRRNPRPRVSWVLKALSHYFVRQC